MTQTASSRSMARNHPSQMDRVTEAGRPAVAPPVDVYENQDELLVFADVPGALRDSVHVELDKGRLTIEARRADDAHGHAVAMESRPCDYFRSFAVPRGIDESRVEAQDRKSTRLNSSHVVTSRMPSSA